MSFNIKYRNDKEYNYHIACMKLAYARNIDCNLSIKDLQNILCFQFADIKRVEEAINHKLVDLSVLYFWLKNDNINFKQNIINKIADLKKLNCFI